MSMGKFLVDKKESQRQHLLPLLHMFLTVSVSQSHQAINRHKPLFLQLVGVPLLHAHLFYLDQKYMFVDKFRALHDE